MLDIISDITNVFSAVADWIASAVQNVIPMFYQAGEGGGLTFLGTLAIAGLGFSVIFLLIGLIQNFLHFRG